MAFVLKKDESTNYAMEYLEPIEGKTSDEILQVLLQNVEPTNAIAGHIGGCILTANRTASGKPAAGLIEHWSKDADWESIEVQMGPVLAAVGELSDLSKTETYFMDLVTIGSKSGEPYSLAKDDSLVSQFIRVPVEALEKAIYEQEKVLKEKLEASEELQLYAIFKTGDSTKMIVVEKWSSPKHALNRANQLAVVVGNEEKKHEQENLVSKDVHSATVVCIE